MQEAMATERPDKSAVTESTEPQKPSVTDVTKWRKVVDIATNILEAKSKDLEVCALLVEALARTSGPASR